MGMMDERDNTSSSVLRDVLEVARGVVDELDLDVVLERVVEAARQLSGAQYAALGVLDDSRRELERFLTSGLDEQARRRIGSLPRGRGVLGELIEHPVTLRLADVGGHPRSYGFPPGHPPMRTFLGVPVVAGEEPFGNLYLAEKAGGVEFTEEDERAVELLAEFAGVAIDHARRYSGLQERHSDLRRTVDALEATLQIARALGGETDLAKILELVAKRGRALVSARALVIEHEQGGQMVVTAGAGDLPDALIGQGVDMLDSVASAALRTLKTLRLEDDANRMRFERHGLGRLGFKASAGLIVPLLFRGTGHGVLIAIDRLQDGPTFTAEDQRLLEAFAASAATAVATAETVQAERRRHRLAAAEQERARWARELHDETLQSLAALRVGLATQLRSAQVGPMADTVRDAVADLEREIVNLRALITDLRPAALDDVGAGAAIEDLAERARGRGLDVDTSVDLSYEQGRASERHTVDLETALYRIVQEALTNAVRHGGARRASVEIEEDETAVRITIRDDGQGFDPTVKAAGFGLVGMRERAELLDGTLQVESEPGRGTTIRAVLPVQRRSSAQAA
jgi:signal transduction histidine kinase